MQLAEHIASDPAICGRRPTVAGTGLRVSDVLDALAGGGSAAELLADCPYLTPEALRACLADGARAADHPVVSAAA